MSALPTSPGLTADEALLLPDAENYELYDGQLKEREMSVGAAWVGNRIGSRLDAYSETHGGWAFGDGLAVKLWPVPSRRYVRPDAAFVTESRTAGEEVPTDGFLTIPPDIVVEVISPGDSWDEVDEKIEEYLKAGVSAVWAVSLRTRRLLVYREGAAIQVFPEGSVFEGDPELPGFSCAVSDLLPVRRGKGRS